MTTSTERVAAQIIALRKRVDSLARTPQLAYSAIDDGALALKDGSGQLTGIVGRAFDKTYGAFTVAGPTPPVPTAPTMTATPGGVIVHWDGRFADPQPSFTSPVVAPMDYQRMEVEVSTDPTFADGGFGPNRGSIPSAAGGDLFVAWGTGGTPLYARLRTRAMSGKVSAPGATVGPVQSGQVQLGDLGFDIANYAGGTTIYYGPATPTPRGSGGFLPGDVWFKEIAAGPPPHYEVWRWLGAAWAPVVDQGIADSLATAVAAQAAADAKAKLFSQPTAPSYTGAASTAVWFDTANGGLRNVWDGAAWAPSPLGNGSIQPQSLIASNVLVTGSITAALLEATMVLATLLIAGDPLGDHSAMGSDGFHVYKQIAGEGSVPIEVGRFGSGSNNFFGLVDGFGNAVATIDDAGGAVFQDLWVTNDPVINGMTLSERLNVAGAGRIMGYFRNKLTADLTPVQSEIGVCEVSGYLTAGRMYAIRTHFSWAQFKPNQEAMFRIRSSKPANKGDDTAPAPTITSTTEEVWWRTHSQTNRDFTEDLEIIYPCTINGRHRFALTAQRNSGAPNIGRSLASGEVSITPIANAPTSASISFPWAFDVPPNVFCTAVTTVPGSQVQEVSAQNVTTTGADIFIYRTNTTATTVNWIAIGDTENGGGLTIDNALLTTMYILDLGPTPATAGQITAAGGTIGAGGTQPPSPSTIKAQTIKEIVPTGSATYTGAGVERTDTTEVVQGYDSSSNNGDGKGYLWFTLPAINANAISKIELELYCVWTGMTSGGSAILNLSTATGVASPNFTKLKTDTIYGGFSRNTKKRITLPSSWYTQFQTTPTAGARATTITFGPGGGTNPLYYCRFDPARSKLIITMTQ